MKHLLWFVKIQEHSATRLASSDPDPRTPCQTGHHQEPRTRQLASRDLQEKIRPAVKDKTSNASTMGCTTPVLGFAGLAKNTGKTTALQSWLEAEADACAPAGVVSIGVDGERVDAVGGHAKPQVRIPEGGLAVTAERAFREEEGAWDVLALLGRRSVLGELLLLRARRRSSLVLAGIRHAADLQHALFTLQEAGARSVLVDGALQRRIVADPAMVTGAVLCTGHVLGNTVEDVVAHTERALRAWRLPEPSALETLTIGSLLKPGELPVYNGQGPWRLDLGGALTPLGLMRVLSLPVPPGEIVLRHGGHDHLDAPSRRRLEAHGITLAGHQRTDLLAIAVNPVHPDGRRLDSVRLCEALRARNPGIPVYDPRLDPFP